MNNNVDNIIHCNINTEYVRGNIIVNVMIDLNLTHTHLCPLPPVPFNTRFTELVDKNTTKIIHKETFAHENKTKFVFTVS